MGLRVFNLETHTTRVLTDGADNLPYWSPEGTRILFTRKQDDNFDIYIIKPDGTDLKRMTTSPQMTRTPCGVETANTSCGTAVSMGFVMRQPSMTIHSNLTVRTGS